MASLHRRRAWCCLVALIASSWSSVVVVDAFTPQRQNQVVVGSSFRSSSFSGWGIPTQSTRTTNTATVTRTATSLSMMFDQLTSAISDVAKNLGPKKRMTEASIKPALRQVRRALLDADVNVDVADTLIEGVQKRSLGQEVIQGVTAEQQFVKAMYDELLDMMGGDSSVASNGPQLFPAATLAVGKPGEPAVILLAGLQGAGKTTACGKLALYLKEREVDYDKVAATEQEDLPTVSSRFPKRQRNVLLVAADVYRPAAISQLQVLGQRVGVDVYAQTIDDDPVDIVQAGLAKAKAEGYDTVIVDTAGRQVIDSDLMLELERIKKVSQAQETLLIVDAMTGQEAASLTAAFDNAVGLTGAILTKMDGDSRGGAAVSVRGVSGKPIKFVGTGEKTEDMEPFFPDRMASRILGMGDVVSLVEKAASTVSDAEAIRLQQKMKDASFDFDDFLKQMELVAKMGSMAGIAKLMPGLGGNLNMNQLRDAEVRMKKNKAMINSMTKKERMNPDLLIKDRTARSRLIRITKGSGMDYEAGQQFMSEFQRMRTMMQKQMGGAGAPGGAGDPMALDEGEQMPAMGNRAMRRAAKKKKKGGRGGGLGFG